MIIHDEDIKRIFKENINLDIISIKTCGHDTLRRNKVFKVTSSIEIENAFVIKFYYKHHKQIRELNALKYYNANPLRIIASGVYNDFDWSIYPFIEGMVMDEALKDLRPDQSEVLFYKLGVKMAQFHKSATFDTFGDWIPEKSSKCTSYKRFIISDTERIINNVIKHQLKPEDIFLKAIIEIRERYDNIEQLEFSTLCHRDLDGRNILIKDIENEVDIVCFLDFEKTVRFNPSYDIINLYRKYFFNHKQLIKPFFLGYQSVSDLPNEFKSAFRFNILRMGLDIASWSQRVSMDYYNETIDYLRYIMSEENDLCMKFIE